MEPGRSTTRHRHQYALARQSGLDNHRLTFYAGTSTVPKDVVMAGESMVCDLFERQGGPKDVASRSFEGVTSSSMQGAERASHVFSPESMMATWAAR